VLPLRSDLQSPARRNRKNQDQGQENIVAKKSKGKLTPKQAKFVEAIVEGKTQTDAALDAGYSPLNARQSGSQAMESVRRRMPGLLDELGYTDRAIIDKYLQPLLEATETKFFPYRRQIVKKPPKTKKNVEPIVEMIQVIDKREIAALGTRCFAFDALCKLKGIYAPKQIDFDPTAPAPLVSINMTVIRKSRELAD
jgi:hypothetical protein